MDSARRHQLKAAYREARPSMGVLAVRCVPTGETFLLASKNISADINGLRFKLNSGYHPNRHLLELWRAHGEDAFEFETVEELAYREGAADYDGELAELRDLCLERNPAASLVWR